MKSYLICFYTPQPFCYFCNTKHKRHSVKVAIFARSFQCVLFFSVLRNDIFWLVWLQFLKDRLNLSLNDPICHHFKLFLVQRYVSHNLEKKEKNEKKVALSIHSYFIIIIQIYLLCQFFKSSKKQNEIDFDCFLILKVLHKVIRL